MDVVLNWLAQGVIVTVAAAAALHVIPGSRTQVRYAFIWAAYLLVLLQPAVSPLVTLARNAGVDVAPAARPTVIAIPAVWWTSATLAVGLWAVWFGVHAVVLGRGLLAAHEAKRRARACPGSLLGNLPHWSRVSATGRQARVVVSERVRLAGVLGCGGPVIAIAPRVLAELSADDLDRVLVHEWAHLQRRDELTHVAQRVGRAIVGWHPAAWWLERQLELERELACDEIAVRVTGSAKRYAECLITLASLKGPQDRTLAMLAAVSRSRLHRRLERILSAASAPAVRSWRTPVFSSAVALLACVWGAGHVRVATLAVRSVIVTATASGSTPRLERPTAAAPRGEQPATALRKVAPATTRRPAARVRSAEGGDRRRGEALATKPIASLPAPSFVDASRAIALPLIGASSPPANARADVRASEQRQPAESRSNRWTRAADGGLAIGRVSQDAGIATAGFFRRFGKKFAGSF